MPRIPSTERRSLLVQAALRVIARSGVSAATTRAIVGEADMSLASFHYAFRSHDEMMRELVAYVVDAEVRAAATGLQPGSDIRSALNDGLGAYLDSVIADPGHEQVLQELVLYALRTPGLEHLAIEQYERYRAGVSELLVQGAASAGVEWTVPLPDVARLVVTIVGGVTLAWLADRDTAAARRVLSFAAESLVALTTEATP